MSQKLKIFILLDLVFFSGLANAIINGTLVYPGDFDAVGGVGNYQGIPNCTGTLIEDNLVLTAAHCVLLNQECHNSVNTSYFNSEGCFRKSENFTLFNATLKNESSKRINYTFNGTVVPYPKYGRFNIYDLALIKLHKNVSEILHVSPISVAKPYILPKGTNLTIVGYGNTDCDCQNENSVNKYWSKTNATYVTGRLISIKMLPNGFCSGDSGGPAIDNNMTIVGVLKEGPNDNILKYSSCTDLENVEETVTSLGDTEYIWTKNVTNGATIAPKAGQKPFILDLLCQKNGFNKLIDK
jgi:V8-like Glu-specific endopeptidase